MSAWIRIQNDEALIEVTRVFVVEEHIYVDPVANNVSSTEVAVYSNKKVAKEVLLAFSKNLDKSRRDCEFAVFSFPIEDPGSGVLIYESN